MPPPKPCGSQTTSELHLPDALRQDNSLFRVVQSRVEQNPFRFLPQKSQESLETRLRGRYGSSFRGRSATHSFLGPHPASWVSQPGHQFHTSLAPARTFDSMLGSQRRLVDKSQIHYPDVAFHDNQQGDEQHTPQHYLHQDQIPPRLQMYNRQYIQQPQPVTQIQDNITLQSSSQFNLAASEVHDTSPVEQPMPYANDIDNWVRPRPPVFPHVRKQLEAQSSSEGSSSHSNQVQAEVYDHSASTVRDQHCPASASLVTRKLDPPVPQNLLEPQGLSNQTFHDNNDKVVKEDRYDANLDQMDDNPKKKQKVSTKQKEDKSKQKRKVRTANKTAKSRKKITIKLTNKASCAEVADVSKDTIQSDGQSLHNCKYSNGHKDCKRTTSVEANDAGGSKPTAQKASPGKIVHPSIATDFMVSRMDVAELVDLELRRGDAGVLSQLSLDVFAKIVSQNDILWEQIEPLMD